MENFSNIPINKPSEKSFALVFFVLFIFLAFYFFAKSNLISLLFTIFAFLIIFFGFFFPKILYIPNKMWFKFGIFLGKFIAPLIMGIIYFFILCPTSLFTYLLGYDLMRKKNKPFRKSYWIVRKIPVQPFKDQF